MKNQLRLCTNQLEELTAECLELKKNFNSSRSQLQGAEAALRDITNEKLQLEKRCQKSIKRLKTLETQHTLLENDFAEMQIENLDLSEDVVELQQLQPSAASSSDLQTLGLASNTTVGRTYFIIRCLLRKFQLLRLIASLNL